MIKKYFTKEVKIGLAGIVALFLLYYGINYLKGVNMFKPTTYIFVRFSNVNGLAKSSPVFADGVKVGMVRKIQYDYDHLGNVVVEVQLDDQMRIPKGSSAELIQELMGNVHMNLLLASNPRERENVGDTIPGVMHSGVADNVKDLMPQVQKMLPKIDSILSSLNTLLADPSIRASLHSIQTTTANLAVASSQLKQLTGREVPLLTSKLGRIEDNAIDITDKLNKVDYERMEAKVNQTLDNVKQMTDKLNSKDNSLGLMLNDAGLYNDLHSTVNSANSLLQDLKQNPKRYVHFSIFGKKDK